MTTTYDTQAVGDLVRDLLKATPRSQSKLARHLGIQPPSVNKWGLGKGNPAEDHWAKIETFFDLEPLTLKRVALNDPGWGRSSDVLAAVARAFAAAVRSELDGPDEPFGGRKNASEAAGGVLAAYVDACWAAHRSVRAISDMGGTGPEINEARNALGAALGTAESILGPMTELAASFPDGLSGAAADQAGRFRDLMSEFDNVFGSE